MKARYRFLLYGVAIGLLISYVYGWVSGVSYRLDHIEDFLVHLSEAMRA